MSSARIDVSALPCPKLETRRQAIRVDVGDIVLAGWSRRTGRHAATATLGDARARGIGSHDPGMLSVAHIGATRLTLTWTVPSIVETAFNVYRVAANGTRTWIGATAANVTHFLVGIGTAPNTVLAASTTYSFEVEAVAGDVGLKSNRLDVTTLAGPVAPSQVVAAMDTQRAVRVTWTDHAVDGTGYIVSRATVSGTGVVGAFTTLAAISALPGGALPAGTTSFVDTTAAVNTVYQYRVVTARDADRSATSAASASLRTASTLTAAQAPLAPTVSVVHARQINLSWTHRVAAPTPTVTFGTVTLQVYRRLAARTAANGAPAQVAGSFAPISGPLPSTTTSYSDTSAVPGVSYQYGIGVSNWANTFVPTAASLAVAGVATMNAVTHLVAIPVTAAQPSLCWVDNTVDESAYRVRRRALALNATSNAVTGTLAQLAHLAANVSTFSDGSTLVANTIYEYEIAPMSGTTVGPLATVRAVTTANGALPGVATTTALTAAGSTLTLTWMASTAPAVGGYDVQRCIVVSGTEPCTDATGWTVVGSVVGRRVGMVSFAHTNQAVNHLTRTYFYRVVTKTGGVVTPELFGAPSAARSIVR